MEVDLKIKKVWFDDKNIYLLNDDGIVKSNPLDWFPRLKFAPKEDLEEFTLSPFGIHWKKLDEDLSFEGFECYSK